MQILLLIGIIAWFIFGDPPNTLANWFWKDSPAPWETVDAFYYPYSTDLRVHEKYSGFGSLQDCRNWAYYQASLKGDPNLDRGFYVCGIQKLDDLHGRRVYRATVLNP